MITILLTVICLAFITFTIAEVMLTIKLFNANESRIKSLEKEYKEDSKEAFHQISGLINSSAKTIRLIDKIKSGFNKRYDNLVHDVDNLYNWNKEQTEVMKSIMLNHNTLVDMTYDSLKEIFCDLNECDCSECEFYNECIKYSPKDSNDENKKNIIVENNREAWDSAIASLDNKVIFKMNLSKPEQFDELKNKMKQSGIPDKVIDNYIEQIKYLVKVGIAKEDQSIEVVWGSKNKQGYLATSVLGETNLDKIFQQNPKLLKKQRGQSKEEAKEKIVDPNSKIVKSLNKLYKLSDKE